MNGATPPAGRSAAGGLVTRSGKETAERLAGGPAGNCRACFFAQHTAGSWKDESAVVVGAGIAGVASQIQ